MLDADTVSFAVNARLLAVLFATHTTTALQQHKVLAEMVTMQHCVATHQVLVHRSSPHSQRRLSDLMMGVDVGDVHMGLEGQLDDMLPPEAVDMDVLPPGEASGPRVGTAGPSFYAVPLAQYP